MTLSNNWIILDWHDGEISAIDTSPNPFEIFLLVAIDDNFEEKIYLKSSLQEIEYDQIIKMHSKPPTKDGYYKLTQIIAEVFKKNNIIQAIKCLDLHSDHRGESVSIETEECFIDYKCIDDLFDLGSKNKWFNIFCN
jgi:hypothetical protein